MKKLLQYISFVICVLVTQACKKNFLDEKPSKALLVPTTATDFRALLDNNFIFNATPALTAYADGDFYTTAAEYNAYSQDQERNSYIWAKDIFNNENCWDWDKTYNQIFYTNVILQGLTNLSGGTDIAELKGEALFNRALAFYGLVQEFAPQYHESSATTNLGVPLRLDPDVSKNVPRSNLADTYKQILSDLISARALLPIQTAYKSRPVRAAAYALLSRVYLSMQNYPKAGSYADSCLQSNSTLIDYNTLSTNAKRPFPRILPNGNPEAIYYAYSYPYSYTDSSAPSLTDSLLYRSYGANDLRRTILFGTFAPGLYKFKGNYAGILYVFSGFATDEMFFNRAECSVRSGNTAAGLADLNTVLAKRWKTGTFVPFTVGSSDEALSLILTERRKELTGRNLRWSDLRRLNDDPSFAVTLTRVINGTTYTLEPNSPRYVYPIPPEELKLNPIVQNQR